jgi:hypothetical protein
MRNKAGEKYHDPQAREYRKGNRLGGERRRAIAIALAQGVRHQGHSARVNPVIDRDQKKEDRKGQGEGCKRILRNKLSRKNLIHRVVHGVEEKTNRGRNRESQDQLRNRPLS